MKQTETTMKKVGNTKFYITPFPAFSAAKISGELISVLAPVLGGLAPMLKGVDMSDANKLKGADASKAADLMDMNIDEVLPVLADSLAQVDGNKLEHLARQLLTDNKNIAYENEEGEAERLTYDAANEIFCGEIQDMILLCWEVIKLNFNGFFKKIAGPSGSLRGITDQASMKLKETTAKLGTTNGDSST